MQPGLEFAMNLHEMARRIAVISNVLITISLFVIVISWELSVALFLGCWLLCGVAWVIEGGALKAQPSRAPE